MDSTWFDCFFSISLLWDCPQINLVTTWNTLGVHNHWETQTRASIFQVVEVESLRWCFQGVRDQFWIGSQFLLNWNGFPDLECMAEMMGTTIFHFQYFSCLFPWSNKWGKRTVRDLGVKITRVVWGIEHKGVSLAKWLQIKGCLPSLPNGTKSQGRNQREGASLLRSGLWCLGGVGNDGFLQHKLRAAGYELNIIKQWCLRVKLIGKDS